MASACLTATANMYPFRIKLWRKTLLLIIFVIIVYNHIIFYNYIESMVIITVNTPVSETLTTKPIQPPKCPSAVLENRGIFLNSSSSSAKDFQNVVLITAANWGYLDILQNWEFLADQQGLKWVVAAMDDKIYEELGPDRAFSTTSNSYKVTEAVKFQKKGFNTLSCNKMRQVLRVMEDCKLDVVFSDTDNVFFKNPFEMGSQLESMIKSQRYDYIYQSNNPVGIGGPGEAQCLHGKIVDEGNTGFYYQSHRNEAMKDIIRKTLETCADPENQLDDQSIFWKHFKKELQPTHCDIDNGDDHSDFARNNSSNVTVCCLDPWYYPVGKLTADEYSKDPVSYHANWVVGHDNKIKKLRNSREDGYGWDYSRLKQSRYADVVKKKVQAIMNRFF